MTGNQRSQQKGQLVDVRLNIITWVFPVFMRAARTNLFSNNRL
jgi:hypothetical protein